MNCAKMSLGTMVNLLGYQSINCKVILREKKTISIHSKQEIILCTNNKITKVQIVQISATWISFERINIRAFRARK